MKRWKQVKDQLDAKRNATTTTNDAVPPYKGGGISSASFSDLRQLSSRTSFNDAGPPTSNLFPPVTKSSSRTSLDIPGRLNNFIKKSNSSLELDSASAAAAYNKSVNAFKRFPRPRARTNSNSYGLNDPASSSSPSKITSPRKWVNNLLSQAAPNAEHLETAAQARIRAESDASRSSPAPVSSLVLSNDNAASTSRQIYTLGSGLQRNTSSAGRSASIYSSHLSSASRSTPDLHRSSITRHRDNGALIMDLGGPLPSIAHRTDVQDDVGSPAPLVVRNLDEAPRGTFTPAISTASASAQLTSVSRLRNPWSPDSPRIQSEEDDDVDASIARDRFNSRLAPGEETVLNMLDSASAVGTTLSAAVPPTPFQTATPGTLARSRSFATSTRFQSPASEYSQDFRSPHLAGTSSPAAGVREAIRRRELLDSTAAGSHIPASRSVLSPGTSAFLSNVGSEDSQPLRSSQTSSSLFYQRSQQPSSGATHAVKKVSRVAVPTTETSLLSPPASAPSIAFPRRGTAASTTMPISPIDSSLLGTSANATSLWSRPSNAPDTPSTTQDPTSPMPWSAASSEPPKWPTTSQQQQADHGDNSKSIYAIEPVVTPSEVERGVDSRSDLLRTTIPKPGLLRHRTDFTQATSIFSSTEALNISRTSLQKEITSETDAAQASATTAPSTTDSAVIRPLSHVPSVSSSLAAIRGMFSKAASAALAPTTTADSAARSTELPSGLTASTSVAAVAKELEQRSATPSRPCSPEKLTLPASPTKAKDLIAMFESNSANASPTIEQSHSFSRTATPKNKLSPTKCANSAASSLHATIKRQNLLSISVSRSNLGLATSSPASDVAVEDASPVGAKLRAQRFEAGRFRSRRAGLIGVGGDGGDVSFSGLPGDENDDDEHDENVAPDSAPSEVPSVAGRFRSLGTASQHSRSQSTPSDVSINVVGLGSSPARQTAISNRGISHAQDKSSGSVSTGSGSLGRKGAFRNSMMGIMGSLTGKSSSAGAAGASGEPGSFGQTLAPSLLSERRNSAKSDQDDNASNASAATQGTTASFRRKKEEGNLPLTSVTAIQMSGEQPGTKPLRVGALYYFNVHDPNPRWLRVKAVLLPSAVAMSWIPTGGGRENVVLDLRACREVHSVPSPDHPSSVSDVGAASARRQGLDRISPFQLIFDDGVERLAAETAKERVQWVTSVWDVSGGGIRRPVSVHGSDLANAGHDALAKADGFDLTQTVSPASRERDLVGSSPTRSFPVPLGTGTHGSPARPISMRPGSSEEVIDRIGSIWKSELSSELTNKDVQPSFGAAMNIAAASAPPPLPPKEARALAESKSVKSAPDANAADAPKPALATAASAPLPTTSASNSPARAKVRSWQRPPLDLSTGYVHDITPRTPTLVEPTVDTIRSTPASYAEDKSSNDSVNDSAKAIQGDQSPTLSSPDLDGYASARSQGSLIDEFGPRTPVSEAVFNWSRLDKESDLDPSDSASQRPARSEYGTFKSTASAAERKRSLRRKDDDAAQIPDNVVVATKPISERTPAQLLRDSVLGPTMGTPDSSNAILNASPAGRGDRLGTVIEETSSLAQSTRINASVRSNARSKLDEMVARAIGTGSAKSPAAKSALSLVSSGSISSNDVGKLLEFLEEQQKERLSKEKELEDQIRSFQQVVTDLQKKNSTSSSHHSATRNTSIKTAGGDSKVTHMSSRDSELAAMQKKLDMVLDLVTNVVAAPAVHNRAKSESGTILSTANVGDDADSAETARIEGVLAKLLRKMQVSEDAAMTPNSKEMVRAAVLARNPSMVDEWDRMPVELRGNELIKSMEDRAKHGSDGRHEAIQSDYATRPESPEMVRGGSAPSGSANPSGSSIFPDVDPRRRFSASMPRRASGMSIAASTSGTDLSRIPPRSWTSERGVPSPPPNSEWDSKSLLSRPASRATTHMGMPGRAPAQNFRMLGDPSSTQPTPRPIMVQNEPSYGSLDMEAEIRRRRAQQQAASGAPIPSAQLGGWYTPKVAQVEGSGTQASSSSVTADMSNVNLDKPVPPTPSVRWAPGDIVEEPKTVEAGAEKTPDGLGLSMTAAAMGEAKFSGPPPTPGVGQVSSAGSASGGSALGTPNPELATILQALKQSEMARQTQLQQQTEISRYLNELNVWLEKDVVDRSKEWRTLASGVTQLHDELKALKEGRALPSSSDSAQPPSLQRSAAEGALHLAPVPHSRAEVITMGDKANAPASPGRRRPAGSRKWNERRSESPSANEADKSWYKPDDAERGVKSSFKSKAAKAAAAASGALLIRQALREWERFKMMRRAAGMPEDPLPADATGDPAIDSQLPLPSTALQQLRDAADVEDNERIGELIRQCAEAGYGTQAIIELTKHVESKAPEPDSDDADVGEDSPLDGDTLMPTPSPYRTRFDVEEEPEEVKSDEDKGIMKMATPVPARVAAKEKAKEKVVEEAEEAESGSGPTTAALALAVEEILKHLLSSKEEAKQKQTEAEAREAERKATEAERERSLLSLKEREKAELVDLLYSRIAADKAAEEAKQKDLDPKSAIESLVAAINAQKENEVKSAAAADAALRQMTSELLKSTSEQNHKLVEAVNAASRDMLRHNVQQHADEFKRLLHKEVSGMFEDVGKIREAKRHLEFEIADLWSIKSRHLQTGAGMPIGYNVPGGYPGSPQAGGMGMGMPMPMAMPVPQITHIHASPMPTHPPAHLSPIPPPQAAAPPPVAAGAGQIDSLRAQKKAVKAALRQAVADSAAPAAAQVAPAPAPAAVAAPAAAPAAAPVVAPAGFLARKKDVLNPFSINFGPRAPAV
ncbi:PH domain-containing protein [Pseudozyma hubeiensis]|nr:PH domain-containing protein [Pseudozyma hubeiensis]